LAVAGFAARCEARLCLAAGPVVDILSKNNHRDTENTEIAQRRGSIRTFRAKPL
jgi:hypothetical protein